MIVTFGEYIIPLASVCYFKTTLAINAYPSNNEETSVRLKGKVAVECLLNNGHTITDGKIYDSIAEAQYQIRQSLPPVPEPSGFVANIDEPVLHGNHPITVKPEILPGLGRRPLEADEVDKLIQKSFKDVR